MLDIAVGVFLALAAMRLVDHALVLHRDNRRVQKMKEELMPVAEDFIDRMHKDLIYDTPNHYGYPPDFEPDLKKAKAQIKQLITEARIDELRMARNVDSQFSSADIVNHLEERLAALQGQPQPEE